MIEQYLVALYLSTKYSCGLVGVSLICEQMPAFPIAVTGFALSNEFEGASPDVKKEPEEMLQTEHAEQADGGGATPLHIVLDFKFMATYMRK